MARKYKVYRGKYQGIAYDRRGNVTDVWETKKRNVARRMMNDLCHKVPGIAKAVVRVGFLGKRPRTVMSCTSRK